MIVGKKLYRMKQCADSMAWARKHLDQAPDGAVFLADTLTHARGRQGREWKLYTGQLCVTVLLKPPQLIVLHGDEIAIRLNQLNMAVCLGVAQALKRYDIGLKWPNDFVFENKKVAGMLMQLVWQGSSPTGIIVGFSINVNNEFATTDELYAEATSLKTIVGGAIVMRTLYKEVLAGIDAWYQCWLAEQFVDIYKAWKALQVCLGTPVQVHNKDGSLVTGVAQQVLPNGDLMIKDHTNKQKTISFYQVEEIKITK